MLGVTVPSIPSDIFHDIILQEKRYSREGNFMKGVEIELFLSVKLFTVA
jgi:hypothetical protein